MECVAPNNVNNTILHAHNICRFSILLVSMEAKQHRTNLYTYFAAFTLSLLMLCLGIATTWSSPILFKLKNPDNPLERAITPNEASWIASLVSLGSAIGPIPFGFVASAFGRKPTLISVAVMFLASFVILAFARIMALFYVGRLLAGVAIAGAFTMCPTYASEIAHHKERALLNILSQQTALVGLLIPYVIGPYLSIMWFNLLCAVFPLIFLCVFCVYMDETPHYLIAKNKHERAVKALKKLRHGNPKVIQTEYDETKRYVEMYNEGTLKDVFRSKLLVKCFFIAVGLASFTQLTGFVPLTNYTQIIFEAAGTNLPSDVSAIIFGLMECVFGFGSVFVIPRFRFRTLLVCSNIGLITSLSIFGAYFYLKDNTDVDLSKFGWVPVVFMTGAVVSFLYGAGVLPTLIISEIFPTNLRAAVLSVAVTIGFIVSFLITKFYSALNEAVGIAGSSWIFASFCVLGLVFDYLFVPETNGKTFQEIQENLRM